ncbi:MAG: CbbQ/NirQ/NorQ/GpvN family protein [Spirochaetales bacterium]|nr:CbbQ/NirQ/NorQ/GpvN family protein [Spirochaetales bacterium]
MMESGYRIEQKPYYVPIRDEVEIFQRAWAEKIPVLLKGPTGCGKTRFVEFMAWRLGNLGNGLQKQFPGVGSLYTVACHEDLTARDLTGRYVLKGGEAVWVDGPAAKAVREGAILYLDEVVEARKDVTVIIHPLTDYRRVLPIEGLGVQIEAPRTFMVVLSYNPGYQSVRKNLKPSTKQRFVALNFTYPPVEKEIEIVSHEGEVDRATAEKLVLIGKDIRGISNIDLEEGVSTRALIHGARLIKRGIAPKRACSIAIAQAISDEPDEIQAVEMIIENVFG